MGLCVTFVSGLRRSGKSAVIRTMVDRVWKKQPHYIRLAKIGGDKRQPTLTANPASADCPIATARWIEYDSEHVFEVLPEALAAIHREDRFGSVVVEADADPVLRCAYPYDHRIFVMPVPSRIGEVFRDPAHAAEELQRALDDTAAFASEIFGLFSTDDEPDADPPEERPELTETNLRGFLYSPLGDELATRIQLQPDFHGLVESDVIIINSKVGAGGAQTDECLGRLQRMLDRLSAYSGQRSRLFRCDPLDHRDQDCKKLLAALKPMCLGGQ